MNESAERAEVVVAEDRLCDAMRESNVAALDELIDDELVFIGPDGGIYDKRSDLDLHRSGQSRFSRIERTKTRLVAHGNVVVATVDAKLAGTFRGAAFESDVRYLRVWQKQPTGWRIIAGSVTAAVLADG